MVITHLFIKNKNQNVMFKFFKRFMPFVSSAYWENRYKTGGNSGAGSYNKLAEFKAAVLNQAMLEFQVRKVIEFGCGDGNQLSMLNVPDYIGLDVSQTVLQHCILKFKEDKRKSFFLYNYKCFADNGNLFRCDASFSIDVIYHLIEQDVYEKYLEHLFRSAQKLVIIYGIDMDHAPKNSYHELYRKFTDYILNSFPEWKLLKTVKNKYPAKEYGPIEGSFADFYFFVKE